MFGYSMPRSAMRSSLALPLSVLALAAACWAAGAHADVYKYTDAKGNVQYTDKPQVLPAELMRLQSKPTDAAAAQTRSAEEMKRSEALIAAANPKPAAESSDQKAAAELTAKDKAERCIKARQRYDSYMNSQRLYKPGPNGEREYLSDEQLTASRTAAKTTMEELCK